MRLPQRGWPGRLLVLLLTVVTAGPLAIAAPAIAAPARARPGLDAAVTTTGPAGADSIQRTLRYWTADRMARARPAETRFASGSAGTGRGVQPLAGGFEWPDPSAPVAMRTGRVFFTLGGVDFTCSGSTVVSENHDVVWTAGHCVHGGAGGTFAENWVFAPGWRDGAAPYGLWVARQLGTTTGWSVYGAFSYDFGAAVMNPGGNLGTDIMDLAGGLPIVFSQSIDVAVYAFGYPAVPAPYTGERLIYCVDTTFPDFSKNPTAVGIGCDMRGGASGGPWLIDFDGLTGTVYSVTSYSYLDDPAHLFAPYQGGHARSLFFRVRYV